MNSRSHAAAGIFPRESVYYDRYLVAEGFDADEKIAWQAKLMLFLRKLCAFSGARPLLKNPCHTGRVEMLLDLFPGAKFVHIYRNPYTVYLSNANSAREGLCMFQFQDLVPCFKAEEFPMFAAWYLAGADPRIPYASPVFGDVAGLPPVLIQVGSHEMVLDDSVRVAEKLRRARRRD